MGALSLLLFLRIMLVSTLFLEGGLAGSITEGGSCSPANDRIDSSTHKFTSDCDDRAFCSLTSSPNSTSLTSITTVASASGICTRRLCRRDEFPFGFASGELLPPICPRGFFCPDDGSGCQPLLPVGAPCDMDRDYQCGPPKRWYSAASEWNFNGSICLQSTCMYANVTIGLPCILEQTTYTGYNRDNVAYKITISRDNCLSSKPTLYCSATTSLCEKMKNLDEPCGSDRECLSQFCDSRTNACNEPPGMPMDVKSWQYALTIPSVLGAVVTICIFLALGHKRRRMERYYELLEYYHEQTSLRASIISLHEAAAQRLSKGKFHDL